MMTTRDWDTSKDTMTLVKETVINVDTWLETPHPQLGWRKPNSLLGTRDEVLLRTLLINTKNWQSI